MSGDGGRDTDRKVVKTYIPAYQKAEWRDHADELGMSQSEFLRTMVQAGRRGFGESEPDASETQKSNDSGENGASDELADRVETVLTADEYHSWDELLASITDNIEDRLEETLAELQDENVVRYSGRNGGYTLVEP